MRAIKFRFWERIGKKMHHWEKRKDHYQAWIVGILDEPSEDWVPMQFTGMHDKNGKEIYEGDIVEFTSEYVGSDQHGNKTRKTLSVKETVKFDHGSFYPNSGVEAGQVIGNIYENPELLTPPKTSTT